MTMDALTKAAAARIEAAVKPCPAGAGSIPEVAAADVLAVAAAVKEPTPVVAGLVKGATGAAKTRHGKCHQNADHLRHLLEVAGASP